MKLDRRNMTHATTMSYELRLTCSISNIYLQWRRQVLEVKGANIWVVDGGTEGPERGAPARARRSAEGVESGEGRRSPSQVWGLRAMPQKNFQKN